MAEVVRDDQIPAGSGDAAEVAPVPAASVILLRDVPLEVLMILRHKKSSFVPSAWVFPGGAVDESDRRPGADSLQTMRIAAARELFEETGIWLGAPFSGAAAAREALLSGGIAFGDLLDRSPLDLQQLVWTSRWITPVGVPKRFDTYFFLAGVDRGVEAAVQRSEAVDATWIAPEAAIRSHERGEFPMVFPTLKNLEALAGFATAAKLIDSRRGSRIPTIRPRLVIENGRKKIVLP